MNVTHRQRHEVERIPNGILHLFFFFLVPLRFHLLSNQNSCSYETTTANTFLTIRERPSLWRSPCRSDKRKKT